MDCVRKSWSIIGLACLLFTTLFGGVLLAAAEDSYTTVIPPQFADTVSVGSAFPNTVVPEGSATAVQNPCNIGTAPGLQVSTYFRADFQGAQGGAGVMLYVKTPDNDTATRLQIYLIKNTSTQQFQYGYADWYTLVEGDSVWTGITIDNYGPLLPARFEGYLYIPYTSITYPAAITGTDTINGMQVWFATNDGQNFIMSAPSIVKGDYLVNNLPTTSKIKIDGTPVSLFKPEEDPPVTKPTVPPAPGQTPDYTIVVPPEYVSYNGQQPVAAAINAGETFPDTVVTRGTATAVENPCNFGTAPGMKVTGGLDVNILGAKGGVGVMVYVKAPSNDTETRFQMYLLKNITTAQFQYGYADWYTLKKGDTQWTSQTITNYGSLLPAGFEGYVYVPYSSITLTGSAQVQPITDEDVITGMQVWFGGNGEAEFVISAPIIVSPHGLKNNLPTANKIIVNGTAVDLFAGDGSGGDDDDDDGDDQELPEINYGNLDITEIKTPNLVGDFKKNFTTSGFDDWNELNSSEKVDSLVGIGAYSSIKVQKQTGAVDSDLLCSFYPDTSESDGGTSVIGYIKMPANSEATIMKLLFNFTDLKGRSISAFVYSGVCYLMARGEKEWTQAPVNSYYFDLPAGFDGYVRFDYDKLYSQGLDGGVPSTYKLNTMHIYIPDTTGDPIYVHPPMLITHQGNSKNGAYINGNKRAALNIFTGAVLQKSDLVTVIKIGDIIKNMPAPTTDKVIHDWNEEDVTTTTAKLSWEAFDGAASYRVDIFKKITGAEGLEFLYGDVKVTTEPGITLTGLSPNTRYAIMVTALDGNGQELAIYDYCNLQTPLEDEDSGTGTTTTQKGKDGVNTGDAASAVSVMMFTLVIAGAFGMLLTRRKSRVS